MGYTSSELPQPAEYPGFQETFKYIFYGRDYNEIGTSSINKGATTSNKPRPLLPPLSERLSAWFETRKKLFNKWIGK